MRPALRAIVSSGGPRVNANFAAGQYSSVAGTKRPAPDPLDASALGVYAEEATRNDVFDSEVTTTGGPGGLPTNWSVANSIGGITPSVVSNDATGVTIRLQGTAGSTGIYFLTMGSTTAVVAAASEVWTASVEVQQVAASGITANGLFFLERNEAGVFVNYATTAKTFQTDVLFPEVAKRTIAAGPRITMGLYLSANSGAAVDVTYKIRHPQLEKKAYPTSYKATPWNDGADRAADALLSTAPRPAGTYIISGQASPFIGTGTLLQIDDGTNDNRVTLHIAAFNLYCEVVKGGVQDSDTYLGRVLPLITVKAGLSLSSGSYSASFNGKTALTVALPANFPAMARTQLGAGNYGAWGGTLASYKEFARSISLGTARASTTPSGLFDDFDRAAGAIGVPPTGNAYAQGFVSNLAVINADKFLVTADSGTATTASYNGVDLGANPSRFMAAVAYSAGTQDWGNATLVATARGLVYNANITDGSVHIGFLDNAIAVQGFPGGVFTTYATFTYPTRCTLDDATVYNFGWRIVGDGFIVLMNDGTLRRVVSAELASELGRYAIYESYWTGPDAATAATRPRSKFAAVAVY